MKKQFKKILATSLIALGISVPVVASSVFVVSCSSNDQSSTTNSDLNEYPPSSDQSGGSGDNTNNNNGEVQKPLIDFSSKLNYRWQYSDLVYENDLMYVYEKIKNNEYRMFNDDGTPIKYEVTLSLSDDLFVGYYRVDPDKPFDWNKNFYKKIGSPDPEDTTIKFIFYKDNSGKFVAEDINRKEFGYCSDFSCYSSDFVITAKLALKDAPYVSTRGYATAIRIDTDNIVFYNTQDCYDSELLSLCISGTDVFTNSDLYANKLDPEWNKETHSKYLSEVRFADFFISSQRSKYNIGSFSIKEYKPFIN